MFQVDMMSSFVKFTDDFKFIAKLTMHVVATWVNGVRWKNGAQKTAGKQLTDSEVWERETETEGKRERQEPIILNKRVTWVAGIWIDAGNVHQEARARGWLLEQRIRYLDASWFNWPVSLWYRIFLQRMFLYSHFTIHQITLRKYKRSKLNLTVTRCMLWYLAHNCLVLRWGTEGKERRKKRKEKKEKKRKKSKDEAEYFSMWQMYKYIHH